MNQILSNLILKPKTKKPKPNKPKSKTPKPTKPKNLN